MRLFLQQGRVANPPYRVDYFQGRRYEEKSFSDGQSP